MTGLLGQTEHKQFHDGLERLGRYLGAQPTRTNEQGAPDVVWSFEDNLHIVFEAKTEKSDQGVLSKDDVLQARGHVDWVKAKLAGNTAAGRIVPVIVSPTRKLHDAAKPHIAGLSWVNPADVLQLAQTTGEALSELRTSFSGTDFGQVRDAFCARVKLSNLHVDGLVELMTSNAL